MAAALNFTVPPGFDKRVYLRGFEEGCEYKRALYEKAAPGDPRIRVDMFCCGAILHYAWDTFPLEKQLCECGSGVAVAEWKEKA